MKMNVVHIEGDHMNTIVTSKEDILKNSRELIREKGYRIGNLDATIIAQKPKLMSYLPQMRKKLAEVMEISEDRLNLKATTEEHLGFTGRQKGISAHCVCLLEEM